MQKKLHEPYANFKLWIRENNLNYNKIGEFLGLSAVAVCRKINGQSDFTLSEVNALKIRYNLESTIFFAPHVA